jgi:hypothetical protein
VTPETSTRASAPAFPARRRFRRRGVQYAAASRINSGQRGLNHRRCPTRCLLPRPAVSAGRERSKFAGSEFRVRGKARPPARTDAFAVRAPHPTPLSPRGKSGARENSTPTSISSTDLPDRQFCEFAVQPSLQNYFASRFGRNSIIASAIPPRSERRTRRHGRWVRDAVDALVSLDERRSRGPRSRGCGCIAHPAFPAPSYSRG